VPWHTCPSCKRSLLITKFAQHLEKCMGIGGRSARNVAAARLGLGNNGSSAAGSNAGSRMGTPTPSLLMANGKREADDDDDDGPPKKKPRKERKDKKEKAERKEKVLIKFKAKVEPPSSKTSAGERLAELDANGKRDRDDGAADDDDEDDDEDVAPKKKLKVSNEGSPAPDILSGPS
jgi:ribonuclease P/MRP protein subunit POP1